MPVKTKTNYSPNSNGGKVKDSFQTPRYGTELLIPHIPLGYSRIWECAAGEGRMSQHFIDAGYLVESTTLNPPEGSPIEDWDFLNIYLPKRIRLWISNGEKFVIATNVPFSIKESFYKRAKLIGAPFAFLIPADWSGWIVRAFQDDGAEAIVPTRRIDYITPNILRNILRREIWKNRPDLFSASVLNGDFSEKEKMPLFDKFNDVPEEVWNRLSEREDVSEWKYESIDHVPDDLLRKYSSSDFHSMWLTHGFDIGRSHTFVELSNKDKERMK